MADDVAPGLGPFATYHVESKFLVTGKLQKNGSLLGYHLKHTPRERAGKGNQRNIHCRVSALSNMKGNPTLEMKVPSGVPTRIA